MRIIAGTHRGRRYLPPKDEQTTRPITDRVKQSLFDRLWSMGAMPEDPEEAGDADAPTGDTVELQGAGVMRVLDIFCGTGSLGLEALSRGVGHCTFVDMDRDAVGRLERNLTELGLKDRARIVKSSALNPIWLGQVPAGSVSLIFLDPPYAMAEDERGVNDLSRLLTALAKVAGKGCVLVYRTPKHVEPITVEGWQWPASHTYGSMTLHFYVRG